MNGRRVTRTLAAALLGGLALVTPATAAPTAPGQDGWSPTGEGITAGISGAAPTGEGTPAGTDVLVVHDNKHPAEPKVSLVRFTTGLAPSASVLRWEGDRDPVDLEALTAVPGVRGEFVALESSGRGYHLRLAGDSVWALRQFTLPGSPAATGDGSWSPTGDNYEAFALTGTPFGGLTAVWAHRGQDEDPAVLNAAALDWGSLSFGPRSSAPVRVSYPAADVRHISDLAVSPAGRLTVTSASDPGNDGPFDSAVYDAGRLVTGGPDGPSPAPAARPRRLAVFPGHKIEALGCGTATGAVLGTDDENAGGSVRLAALCPTA
ncbi:hypothetical protein JNUCC64_02870 [Streptomyces sp. JNUCC 64]